ncbi:MAG: hypothetical protein ACKPAH_14835, partial [Verrucomicrobiota bacterium]
MGLMGLLPWVAAACALVPAAAAQDGVDGAPQGPSPAAFPEVAGTLPRTTILGESDADDVVSRPFPAEVEGTKVYAGKKVTLLDFDALPQMQNDNYRQAFSQIPGLLVSELPNASLLSLGYRGIGDPHESQNLLVLKDGLPFVLDLYGYPTVYFAPPFESVD